VQHLFKVSDLLVLLIKQLLWRKASDLSLQFLLQRLVLHVHFLDRLDSVFRRVCNRLTVRNLREPFLSLSYLPLKLCILFTHSLELVIFRGLLHLIQLFGQVDGVGLQSVISQLQLLHIAAGFLFLLKKALFEIAVPGL